MLHMEQKCSIIRVLEVFFLEPMKIHFIREISKKIGLATTSVSNNLRELLKQDLIIKKEARPFNGYAANRENDKFLFYKRAYNLYSLYDVKNIIAEEINPKTVIVFGSYSKGEDIESSDIDILIISNVKKKLDLEKAEKKLNRKINIIFSKNIEELDKPLRKNILNGLVLYGNI